MALEEIKPCTGGTEKQNNYATDLKTEKLQELSEKIQEKEQKGKSADVKKESYRIINDYVTFAPNAITGDYTAFISSLKKGNEEAWDNFVKTFTQ